MDKCNCTARFFSKIVPTLLTQTDTTVGFLSQDDTKLKEIKIRVSSKPFITVFKNIQSFKNDFKRVPQKHKNRVRRASKTTFIIKNFAFRIAYSQANSSLLDLPWYYSTSANESSKNFDRVFCESKADIIIETEEGLHEKQASSLLRLNAKKIRKLR